MRYNSWLHAAPSLLNLPLDPEKGGPAAVFRALQENAAIVAHRNLEAVFTSPRSAPFARIIFPANGGAAPLPHWAQILADVVGLPVAVPEVKEATALGCAALAASGARFFADAGEAGRSWTRLGPSIEPGPRCARPTTGPRTGGSALTLPSAPSSSTGSPRRCGVRPAHEARNEEREMLIQLVRIRVQPGHRNTFIAAFTLNCEGTRKEPGNLRFDLLCDPDDENSFSVYENLPRRGGT